jgi:hypothetical protein
MPVRWKFTVIACRIVSVICCALIAVHILRTKMDAICTVHLGAISTQVLDPMACCSDRAAQAGATYAMYNVLITYSILCVVNI